MPKDLSPLVPCTDKHMSRISYLKHANGVTNKVYWCGNCRNTLNPDGTLRKSFFDLEEDKPKKQKIVKKIKKPKDTLF